MSRKRERERYEEILDVEEDSQCTLDVAVAQCVCCAFLHMGASHIYTHT